MSTASGKSRTAAYGCATAGYVHSVCQRPIAVPRPWLRSGIPERTPEAGPEVWRFCHSSMARTCPSSAPSSLRASSLVRRQRRRQVGFVLVVRGKEERGDGAGFIGFAGLGDEFVKLAQKLGRKPTGFSGFLALSHSPNSVSVPNQSATLKLHSVPPGFRPKSPICNLISEIALLTLPRPPGASQSAFESAFQSGFHEAFEKPFDKPCHNHFQRPSEQPFDMALETAFDKPFQMALEMAFAVALQVAFVLASPKPLVEPPPVASGIAFLCADQVGDIGAGEMPAP